MIVWLRDQNLEKSVIRNSDSLSELRKRIHRFSGINILGLGAEGKQLPNRSKALSSNPITAKTKQNNTKNI
jgi:hypothetical protein